MFEVEVENMIESKKLGTTFEYKSIGPLNGNFLKLVFVLYVGLLIFLVILIAPSLKKK